MNIKLIAIVTAAFVVGHDIAAYRADQKLRTERALNKRRNSETALTWFHLGRKIALADPNAVAEAFNQMHPAPPAQNLN